MADHNLASMILEEVPTQLVDCYKLKGIKADEE